MANLSQEVQNTIFNDDTNFGIEGIESSDMNDVLKLRELENEVTLKKQRLELAITIANKEVPRKLKVALEKAEKHKKDVEEFTVRSDHLNEKINGFLNKTVTLRTELDKRCTAINELTKVLHYLKTYESIEELSEQLKQCTDDELAVLLYGELKVLSANYQEGHRAAYVKECTHYWHNVLKDKFTKQYDDLLKLVKWPFTSVTDNVMPSKENLTKFHNLTKYLFLIEETYEGKIPTDGEAEPVVCLPVRLLLRPLKKRFAFHFLGPRQTARTDRPEWFLSQTLSWIKDHCDFIKKHVQPIAVKLQLVHVKAEDEFTESLIAMAAERVHTVLGLYLNGDTSLDSMDLNAAFAHAVDETLGFHKEVTQLTGKDCNSVLSVLTKADNFVKWISVEKKYAIAKMDEMLSSNQWTETVAARGGAAVGTVLWVPRGSDWFISLLKTIEDRYVVLPQPGHRLQFLSLQLDLVEEWRVRLTQLLSAAISTLCEGSFAKADDSPHPLTAVINAAHHTRTVLLQWAHNLHYLQLYFYQRQFENFTQQHHEAGVEDMPEFEDAKSQTNTTQAIMPTSFLMVRDTEDPTSLTEVESRANKMALNEASRRISIIPELDSIVPMAPMRPPDFDEFLTSDEEDSGVFGEGPSLLLHLRESGLSSLCEHIMLEFKAAIKDYKRQRWHTMCIVEEMALSVSPSLCRPLSGLSARLHAAQAKLAPTLSTKLRTHLAMEVDNCLYEEVVLENCWSTGGTVQFRHDISRNLLPVFSTTKKIHANSFPKLVEACQLLDLDYDDGRRLRASLLKKSNNGKEILLNRKFKCITPLDAIRILNQRTDLNENAQGHSMMNIF